MFGSVVKRQPFGDVPGFRRREGLIQRRHPVGVQIVQDHSNRRDVGICFIHQAAHMAGEVLFGAPLCHRHVPPGGQWFAGQEQVAGALQPIFVVLASQLSRLRWEGPPRVGQQLGGGLIESDHRPLGIEWLGLQVLDIPDMSHEVATHLGNAPLLLLPRLEDVIFRGKCTAS